MAIASLKSRLDKLEELTPIDEYALLDIVTSTDGSKVFTHHGEEVDLEEVQSKYRYVTSMPVKDINL